MSSGRVKGDPLQRPDGPPAVPAVPADVTFSWLARALERRVDVSSAGGFERTRIGAAFGMTSVVLRVMWSSSARGGAPRPAPSSSVIVKLWDTTGIAGAREVDFYRSFGADASASVPRCHHAAIDDRAGRGVLVLEDFVGAEQGDCLLRLGRDRATEFARTIAALHVRWWGHPRLGSADWLPSMSRWSREPDWVESRREKFLRRFGDRLDDFSRGLLDRVETLLARSDERLAEAPETLLHADLHLDNVLYAGMPPRPVLLDWARVARGPAAIDVIEVLVEVAEPADREIVLASYLESLDAAGVRVDAPAFRRQLGGALLRKFARVTYGIANWEPKSPREERILSSALSRIQNALPVWRAEDPGLFSI